MFEGLLWLVVDTDIVRFRVCYGQGYTDRVRVRARC